MINADGKRFLMKEKILKLYLCSIWSSGFRTTWTFLHGRFLMKKLNILLYDEYFFEDALLCGSKHTLEGINKENGWC